MILDGEVLGDAAPVSFDLADDEPHQLRLELAETLLEAKKFDEALREWN